MLFLAFMCRLKDFNYTVISEGIIAPAVSMWTRKERDADGTGMFKAYV